jgi:hypothetical protein
MAQNSLHDLADRVRQGDTTAATEMRQVLAPNLARIARRAMRHGTENILPLTQPIRDWAERLAPDGPWPQAGGQERLTEHVAEALTEAVMDRLLPMPSLDIRLRETVRN